MNVWCVWTEAGEYEQCRDLRGIFATEQLAEAHANQLRERYDYVDVEADEVLDKVPVDVPSIVTKHSDSGRAATPRRLRSCVEEWPDCEGGAYHPSCCRFPKSCSCTVYDPERISEDLLEGDS